MQQAVERGVKMRGLCVTKWRANGEDACREMEGKRWCWMWEWVTQKEEGWACSDEQ